MIVIRWYIQYSTVYSPNVSSLMAVFGMDRVLTLSIG